MFVPRTTPLTVGEMPWQWDIPSQYQCTWWAYYRCLSLSFSPCCWFDGSGANGDGAYTNAKEWLKHFRDPWEVKGVDYEPVAGDIAVFDGNCGHVQFMETNTMYSEYASGNPDSFRNGTFEKKSNLLGFLHYPYNAVVPVERNISVNQIQTTDTGLRIRTKPSLNGEIVGQVQLGYYNVYDQKDADGYTWYKIEKDRWCANVSTIYLPAEDDILKELERIYKSMKASIDEKDKIIKDRNDRLNKIEEIANYE